MRSKSYYRQCIWNTKREIACFIQKTECRLFNRRYVIMACIALHNLCIELAGPCQPRWKLELQELALIQKQLHREDDMKESALNQMKISNWLLMDH